MMSSRVSELTSEPASAIALATATGGSLDLGGSRLFSSQSFLFARCRSQNTPLTLRVLGRFTLSPPDDAVVKVDDDFPSDSDTDIADFWWVLYFTFNKVTI
jgi:hypothetical protein